MQVKSLIQNNRLPGQLMFLVLFILALVFYLERTIFVDPCYAVFNILYYRDFVSEAGRHTAVIPQTLALFAIKMGMPLKVILGIYSISFILLYYIIYLVIAYGFKLDRIALAVPLVLLVGVKYSFYWISTETHQALVYTILFYAFLTWSVNFKPGIITATTRLVIAGGVLLLSFYAHPISMFTILFVLGFHVIDNKLWLKPEAYLLGGLVIALALFKFLTSSAEGYEAIYFRGFGDFFLRLGQLSTSGSMHFLRAKLFNIYLFPLIMFLVTFGWYLWMKTYLKLAYYLVSLVAFMLVLFTTFNIYFYPFIQEKNLMGLNILILIPFLKDIVLSTNRKQITFQVFLVVMFLAGVVHVTVASGFYKDRLAYIRGIINITRNFPEKKFIITEAMVDRGRLNVNWALAPETLILSSLESPDSSVSVYINDAYGKLSGEMNLDDSLLFICAPWAKHLDVRRLDRHYFNLANSRYRLLTEREMVGGKDIPVFANHFDDPSLRIGADSCTNDGSGNTFFMLKSEFSPGFFGKYRDITNRPAIMVTATVRVCPFEKVDTKWLNLVISRERNQVVYDYYRAGVQPSDSLLAGQWKTMTVSGIVRSTDPNDQLKVYLWNPGKKRIGMDDLEISYRIVR